jgi:hypothetical protein
LDERKCFPVGAAELANVGQHPDRLLVTGDHRLPLLFMTKPVRVHSA